MHTKIELLFKVQSSSNILAGRRAGTLGKKAGESCKKQDGVGVNIAPR